MAQQAAETSAAAAVYRLPQSASPKTPGRAERLMKRAAAPVLVLVLFLAVYEGVVRLFQIPNYLLPGPSDIYKAAARNWDNLTAAVGTTVVESLIGFVVSIFIGIGMAIALALSKPVERAVFPYAVVLQTIPIVAVAPIIVIWFGAGMKAIIVIVFLISFFPILINTLIGLNATDTNMKNLFYLYNATKMQTIWKLRIPAALPYIAAGVKISSSLAVIGAIVGEFTAGIGGGKGGLGYAITVAAARIQIPYLFTCVLAASLLGVALFLAVKAISKRMLQSWHESEMD